MPTDQELIKIVPSKPSACLSGNGILCVFSLWDEYVYQPGMGRRNGKSRGFLILQEFDARPVGIGGAKRQE